MEEHVAIITGGTSGLGLEAVKSLSKTGMHIILACEKQEEADAALEDIKKNVHNAKVEVLLLDLASLQSVKEFVKMFMAKKLPLHILINNAGVMIPSYGLTEDGFELQFGVNYLGHFLLTNLLLDVLKNSGTAENPARVINTASVAHVSGNLNLNDLQSREVYSAHGAYCQSKLAVVMSTYALQRKLSMEGVHVCVNALHPGIVSTALFRHLNPVLQAGLKVLGSLLLLTPRQGADTILYLATSKNIKGGHYYDNCQQVTSCARSYDQHLQDALWHKSCHLVGIAT